MGAGMELHRLAARLCAVLVVMLAMTGYYYANIRFAPVAAGFAILAGVFYSGRLAAVMPTRSLSNSGQHRAL
jgi:hypothetical protein